MLDLNLYQGVQHIFGAFDRLGSVKMRAFSQDLSDIRIITEYCNSYKQWILSTKLNSIKGLEQFPYLTYSNGTTESFDKFYIKHRNKKIKVLQEEYLYHKNYSGAESFYNINSLSKGDALIISAPFVKTGNIHPLMEDILNTCDRLQIPVLIDSAYFGLCGNLNFNFEHPCIEDITFSLSKVFGTYEYRIGIRFSKTNYDGMSQLNSTGYVNRFGAALGIELMREQDPDYLFNRFREKQLEFCKSLDLEASNCVIFGIDTKQLYNIETRFDEQQRFCFSKYLVSGRLP